MATEIRVPTLGESVSEATIGRWFKKAGDPVKADEPICELETDKVTLEVNAPAAGVLAEITAKDGETVEAGGLLGQISEGGAASDALHLWSAPDFRGPWTAHPQNPVLIDIASARPAGRMVMRNGARGMLTGRTTGKPTMDTDTDTKFY